MFGAPSNSPYFTPDYDTISVAFWYWTKCKNHEVHRNEFVSFTILTSSPSRHNTHSLGQKHLYCTASSHLRELRETTRDVRLRLLTSALGKANIKYNTVTSSNLCFRKRMTPK